MNSVVSLSDPSFLKPFLLHRLPKALFVYFVAGNCLAFLGNLHWSLELLTHFKIQLLLASLLFAFVFAATRAWRWAGAAVCVAALNLFAIAPWYVPTARAYPAGDEQRLRLMLSNVLYTNERYDDLLKLVRAEQPDLLVLQEVTEAWERALQPLRQDYPHGAFEPRDQAAGMALLSRRPLTAVVAPINSFLSPSVLAEFEFAGQTVSLLTIHPLPPQGRLRSELRNREFDYAAEFLRTRPDPKILLGDLNVTMWSPNYARLIEQSGLVNVRQGFGVVPTWPAFSRLRLLQIPLDHCLVSPNVRVIDVRTGPHIGSDHLPLIVDLGISQNH